MVSKLRTIVLASVAAVLLLFLALILIHPFVGPGGRQLGERCLTDGMFTCTNRTAFLSPDEDDVFIVELTLQNARDESMILQQIRASDARVGFNVRSCGLYSSQYAEYDGSPIVRGEDWLVRCLLESDYRAGDKFKLTYYIDYTIAGNDTPQSAMGEVALEIQKKP